MESAEHLEIKLTYDLLQKSVQPDLLLELHNTKRPQEKIPLTIDAKYKNYDNFYNSSDSKKQKRAGEKISYDFERASRRYRKAFRGMAFLAHYGKFEAWPARSKGREIQFPLEKDKGDYNFAGGIVQVIPGDTRALRRILVAWLVRNGVLEVCFNCGEDLAVQKEKDPKSVALRTKTGGTFDVPVFTRNYMPEHGSKDFRVLKCCCPTCEAALSFNYCHECKEKERWTPIPKIFYSTQQARLSGGDMEYASKEWIDHVEIVVAGENPGTRCCPHCGSDEVPKKPKA